MCNIAIRWSALNFDVESDVQYRDSLECFKDESYSHLPQKGQLHSLSIQRWFTRPPARVRSHGLTGRGAPMLSVLW
jgi:hypothetical protein